MALLSLNNRLYLNQQGYVHWLYNKVESYDTKRRKFFTDTIKQTESKSIVSSHLSIIWKLNILQTTSNKVYNVIVIHISERKFSTKVRKQKGSELYR